MIDPHYAAGIAATRGLPEYLAFMLVLLGLARLADRAARRWRPWEDEEGGAS